MAFPGRERVSALQVAASLAGVIRRGGFLLAVLVSIILLIFSRLHEEKISVLRTGLTDLLAPVLGTISAPLSALNQAVITTEQFMDVYAENKRLREELRHWQAAGQVATHLSFENKRLRGLLNHVPEAAVHYVSARVVSNSLSPFSHYAVINAGAEDGIKTGQVAINQEGVIGQVMETGRHSARIRLVTDRDFRLPVTLSTSGEQAVLAGAGDHQQARLIRLKHSETVYAGDVALTSGDNALFPSGLVVGAVDSIARDGVRIHPVLDRNRLHHVSILSLTRSE